MRHLTWRRVFLTALAFALLSGCAEQMGSDINSPWMQCAKVNGGPSQTGQIVGGVSPLGAIVADPGYFQAVQDCRNKLLEPTKAAK